MSDEQVAHKSKALPRQEYLCIFLLLLLMAFHFIINTWYISVDNHVIRTDEETHMITAREYYDALFVNEQDSALQYLIETAKIRPSHPAHPPLLPILGALLGGLFGYGADIFTMVNSVMFMLLIVGCFLIAREFLPPWGALLAAFVASFTPSLFHASRFFMTDYPATVVTTWAVLALLKSNYFRNPTWVFVFACLTGVGILFRTVTFLYFIVPAALVAIVGLGQILWRWRKSNDGPSAFGKWLFNCVMTVIVCVGVFSPWYYHNLEHFYNYWVYEHQSAATGGPVTLTTAPVAKKPKAPEKKPAAEKTAPAAVQKEAKPVVAETKATGVVLKRKLTWYRYPIQLINNNLFLVLSVLSAAGLVLALSLKRLRSFPVLVVGVWIFGAYVLMTGLITFANARYAMPVVPACAILAAIPFVALPAGWFRRIAIAALAVVLLFQYYNLTFATFTPKPGLQISMYTPRDVRDPDREPGLVVYKDVLNYGYSYSGLGAAAINDFSAWGEVNTVRECNYKDRLFFAMMNYEKKRRSATGNDALYIRLGREMRGMEFDERHFWRGTPYLRPDLKGDPALAPQRRLRNIMLAPKLSAVETRLPDADYVVYAIDATAKAKEASWVAYLEDNGFERIENFTIEAFGWVPTRSYGVMARKEGALLVVETADDIHQLDVFQLYDMMNSENFETMSDTLQTLAHLRFESLLKAFPQEQRVNDHLTYVGTGITALANGRFRMRFVFRVDKEIEESWRIFFHGRTSADKLNELPERFRKQGYQDWNFNPQPPTNEWRAGSHVIVTNTIDPEPIPYSLKIGFFNYENEYYGNTIQLGQLDFGS